mgnify:CR=1 FL=1
MFATATQKATAQSSVRALRGCGMRSTVMPGVAIGGGGARCDGLAPLRPGIDAQQPLRRLPLRDRGEMLADVPPLLRRVAFEMRTGLKADTEVGPPNTNNVNGGTGSAPSTVVK